MPVVTTPSHVGVPERVSVTYLMSYLYDTVTCIQLTRRNQMAEFRGRGDIISGFMAQEFS